MLSPRVVLTLYIIMFFYTAYYDLSVLQNLAVIIIITILLLLSRLGFPLKYVAPITIGSFLAFAAGIAYFADVPEYIILALLLASSNLVILYCLYLIVSPHLQTEGSHLKSKLFICLTLVFILMVNIFAALAYCQSYI